jgi:CubicO group peptidase (beta-lactamase class C family)
MLVIKFLLVLIGFVVYSCGDINENGEASSYFPPNKTDEWETVTPEELGWNNNALDDLIKWVENHHSSSLIILKNGKIVVEKYWDNGGIDNYIKIASITKSITSVLFGIARQEGLLNITDNVSKYLDFGFSYSSKSIEDQITIRHLLTMTSGLNEDLVSEFKPGSNFLYSNGAFFLLWNLLGEASGLSFDQYCNNKLFEKIGMSSAVRWYKGGLLKPRDLARFGLLVINQGVWNDMEVLEDIDYYNDMISPSQEYLDCYGYLWWLNNSCLSDAQGNKSELFPNAPNELFAAIGSGDQKLYIVPSKKIVIVRLGIASSLPFWGEDSFDGKFWKLFSGVIENELY